jgi:alanyl-tRNA synthetase
VRVTDTHEKNGEIVHSCVAPLREGETVTGSVDREVRLARMQNHSGEHIFSGTAHRLFGCSNVGFHMGGDGMTLDFDCEMDADQVRRIETLSNEAVRENLPVKVWFPSKEELKALEYRSKKELEGAVRIVEIPGVDRCACCAPHVYRTGEIGVIKVLNFERHRGGVRLNLVCGMQALEDYRLRQQSVAEISALLSAKRDEVSAAVSRILQEKEALKEKNAALAMELIRFKAEQQPETDGSICLFETIPDEIAMRELTNLLMEKCGALAAVFFPGEEGAWRYIIGSRTMDLRKEAKAINAGIGGRGGGRPEMIQGSARESEDSIRRFILQYR